MPKDVDHDLRRVELLEAAWRVIARDGIENTTIRSIAAESRWSAGVLAHYFGDKEDILASSLELAYQRTAERLEEVLEGLEGIEALRALVHENLPLDDERELETRFLMNCWGRAMRTRGELPARVRSWPTVHARIVEIVERAQAGGELLDDEEPDLIADRFVALIDGLSLRALLEPAHYTRERLVVVAEQELRRLWAHDDPASDVPLAPPVPASPRSTA